MHPNIEKQVQILDESFRRRAQVTTCKLLFNEQYTVVVEPYLLYKMSNSPDTATTVLCKKQGQTIIYNTSASSGKTVKQMHSDQGTPLLLEIYYAEQQRFTKKVYEESETKDNNSESLLYDFQDDRWEDDDVNADSSYQFHWDMDNMIDDDMDDDTDDRDFTACSSSDCGMCGKCPY